MISQGQFITEFEKLEASFARTVTQKIKDGWFAEVEDVDYRRFKSAIAMLKGSDHFPRFGDFWTAYRATAESADEKQRGCQYCRHGYIHHVQHNAMLKRDDEVVSFCGICWPDHPNAVNPRQTFRYAPGTEPFKQKDSKQIPREDALELVQGFNEAFGKVTQKKGAV